MKRKIAICGVGRLGLPLALNFGRDKNTDVLGYDVNEKYINLLSECDYESE